MLSPFWWHRYPLFKLFLGNSADFNDVMLTALSLLGCILSTCCFKFPLWLKPRPQPAIGHTNGFSLQWMRKWAKNLLTLLNTLLHDDVRHSSENSSTGTSTSCYSSMSLLMTSYSFFCGLSLLYRWSSFILKGKSWSD